MKQLAFAAATLLSLSIITAVSTAQTAPETRPHYRRSSPATVDSVDVPGRILMLKRPEGYFVRLHVPPDAKGFESLKPGDSVKATYYENVIVTLEKGGAVAHTREAVTPVAPGAEHNSPDVRRVATVTVTAVDTKLGNLAFTENGQPYVARVEDKALLKKAKAGDKVDITYTQATLVSLQ